MIRSGGDACVRDAGGGEVESGGGIAREPLLALSSVPELLVHYGVDDDGGDLLLEQKKLKLQLEIDLLEKHQ